MIFNRKEREKRKDLAAELNHIREIVDKGLFHSNIDLTYSRETGTSVKIPHDSSDFAAKKSGNIQHVQSYQYLVRLGYRATDIDDLSSRWEKLSGEKEVDFDKMENAVETQRSKLLSMEGWYRYGKYNKEGKFNGIETRMEIPQANIETYLLCTGYKYEGRIIGSEEESWVRRSSQAESMTFKQRMDHVKITATDTGIQS